MSAPVLKIDYIDQKSGCDLKKPRNLQEYAALEKKLDEIIDIVRDDETHP